MIDRGREKRKSLVPFIKRVNIRRPPRGRLRLTYDLGVIPIGTVGFAHVCIDENPVIRGTRSLL